jgi:hypothetical protein
MGILAGSTLVLAILFAVTIAKVNSFVNKADKYKTEILETKALAKDAIAKTNHALVTLAVVSTELADCQGVNQDSLRSGSYLKSLLKKKYKEYKDDN